MSPLPSTFPFPPFPHALPLPRLNVWILQDRLRKGRRRRRRRRRLLRRKLVLQLVRQVAEVRLAEEVLQRIRGRALGHAGRGRLKLPPQHAEDDRKALDLSRQEAFQELIERRDAVAIDLNNLISNQPSMLRYILTTESHHGSSMEQESQGAIGQKAFDAYMSQAEALAWRRLLSVGRGGRLLHRAR